MGFTGAWTQESLAAASVASYKSPCGPYKIDERLPEPWFDAERDRAVPVKIYAPDGTAGRLPLIVFSPGFGESREGYSYLGREWASHGYIVVVVDHPGSDSEAFKQRGWKSLVNPSNYVLRPQDLEFVIDRILSADQDDPLLRGRVDPARIGVAGHSLGSTTALSLAGLTLNTPERKNQSFYDTRVRAVIAMSAQIGNTAGNDSGNTAYARKLKGLGLTGQSWDGIRVPAMIMIGGKDAGIGRAVRENPGLRREAYDRTGGTDKYLVDILDAQHHAFSDTPPFYPGGPRNPLHHGWIEQATLAFFDAYLKGDRAARAWLQDGSLQALSDGAVHQEYAPGGTDGGAEGTAAADGSVAGAAGTAGVSGYDFTAVSDKIKRLVQNLGLPGAAIVLVKDDKVIYEAYFGKFGPDTAVPIASASKWITAATIMTLVDAGALDLDDRVSRYLPEFDGEKGDITVRQLLAFTSGLPRKNACTNNPRITLAACVEDIAHTQLVAAPGKEFRYGGVQMQVAGRIAELVTGQPWEKVFEQHLSEPLKMQSMIYTSPRGPHDYVSDTGNPRIAGGVVTNARDYSHFLRMLLNGGTFEGRRVLSSQAIDQMQQDQTAGAPIAFTIKPDASYRYSFGAWYRVVDSRRGVVRLSSEGGYGAIPWIDLGSGVGGVFLTSTRWSDTLEKFSTELKDAVARSIDPAAMVAGETNPSALPDESEIEPPRPTGRAYPSEALNVRAEQIIQHLDRNKDGQLDREELPLRARQRFTSMDVNRDGVIEMSELAEALPWYAEQRNRRETSSGRFRTQDPGQNDETSAAEHGEHDLQPGAAGDGDYKPGPGPYQVVSETTVLDDAARARQIPLRITFPKAQGEYPIIIFSHYSGGTKDQYQALIRYWSSYGYVCIQPDHLDSPQQGGQRGRQALSAWEERPRDISSILDSLQDLGTQVPGLNGKLDSKHIGVGGHYFGAFTASLLAGATKHTVLLGGKDKDITYKDARVSAALLMSPQGRGDGMDEHAWSGMNIPVMVMTGSKDVSRRTGNSPEWRTEPFQFSPAVDKYLIYINGLYPGYGGIIGPGAAQQSGPPNAEHLRWTSIATLAFWDAYLKNGTVARDYLLQKRLEQFSHGAVSVSAK